MKTLALAFTLTAALALSASTAKAGCSDPDLKTVRDRVLSECSCNGNHGQYVSCVVGKVRQAVHDGELDVNCKGKVVRCAARSTCGKKTGFVTCLTCEPGTCTEGKCDDGVTACSPTLPPCPQVLTHCSTKSDASHCLSGITGTGSCCSAACPPPTP